MKKLSLFLCLFFALTACARKHAKTSRTEFVFGTIVTVTVYGDVKTAEQAIEAAFSRLAEIEELCSYTLPESELSRLNASAYAEPFEASAELYGLISKSLALCEQAGGAFDITLGELIDLWDDEKVPPDEDIKALLPYLGYENVILENNAVKFKNPRIKLHLGGVAKGYAADELAKVFGAYKDISAVADLGGDILLYGRAPNKDGAWNVGIADPFNKGEIADKYFITEGFVMTSGGYERYFERDGVIYHHIFDKNTGYPTNSGIASATVAGRFGIECDAYATAVFASGRTDFEPEGRIFDYVIIDEEGNNSRGSFSGGVCVFGGVDSDEP